jgi:hypothetical protein
MSYTPLQQRTLQVAKRWVGERETGVNRGKKGGIIQTAQLWFGNWMVGQPWCAAFATYCIFKAAKELGVKNPFIKSASSSAIYAWAKKTGRLLNGPEPGCIGLVVAGRNAAKGKSHEHTFLVHNIDGDEVVTIEGNWSNKVRWNRRKKAAANLDWVRI